MATWGSLVANLVLESAAFRRDMTAAANHVNSNVAAMKRSMREIEVASANVEKQFGQLRTAAVALGGALAVREFAAWTKEVLENAKALGEQAFVMGLSTKALQEYHAAASLSGITTEKFDQNVARFTKTLGQAKDGTGTLVNELKKTDLAFLNQITSAKSTAEALGMFFDKLSNTADVFKRNELAAAGFGRQGMIMTAMVKDGAGGMRELMASATALGLVLSKELIDKADDIAVHLKVLQTAFSTGFSTGVIESLADSFGLTKDNLQGATRAGKEFGDLVGQAMRVVVTVAQEVGKHLREIEAALAAIIAYKAAVVFLGMASAMTALATAILSARDAMAALNAVLMRNIFGLIAGAIAIVVGLLIENWNTTLKLGSVTTTYGKIATAVFTTIWEIVKGLGLAIFDLTAAFSALIKDPFHFDWKAFAHNWLEAGKAIENAAKGATDAWSHLSTAVEPGWMGRAAAAAGVHSDGTPGGGGDAVAAGYAAANKALEEYIAKLKNEAALARELGYQQKVSNELIKAATEYESKLAETQRVAVSSAIDAAKILGPARTKEISDVVRLSTLIEDLGKTQTKTASDVQSYVTARIQSLTDEVTLDMKKKASLAQYMADMQDSIRLAGMSREQAQEELEVRRQLENNKTAGLDIDEAAIRSMVRMRQETELWRSVVDEVQRGFESFFTDFFETGHLSISKLWDYIKSTFAQLLAWMAAKAIAEPIIVPMVQGVAGAFGLGGGAGGSLSGIGGALAGGGGGLASLLNLGGGFSVPGFGSGQIQVTPSVLTGKFSNGTGGLGSLSGIAGLLGAGAAGYGAGSLGATLLGGNSTSSQSTNGAIGAVIGGAIGTAIAGPVGTAIGSFLGSLAGGLIGPSHASDNTAFANFGAGYSVAGGVTGDKPNSNTLALASQAGAAIAKVTKALTDAGIVLQDGVTRLRIGEQRNSQLQLAGGGFIDVGGVGDVQAAVKGTLDYLLKSAMSNDQNVQAVLGHYQGAGGVSSSNIDQVLSDIDFAKGLANLSFVETKLTQSEQVLKAVTEQFDTAIKRAQELGLETSKIEEARAKAVGELVSGFNQATSDAIDSLVNPTLAAWKALQKAEEDRIAEAQALGASTALLERRADLERQQFLDNLNSEQRAALEGLIDAASELRLRAADAKAALAAANAAAMTAISQQISAASNFGSQMGSLAREYADAAHGISQARGAFLVGDQSPLNPMARLAAARGQFNATGAAAQGGDLDALKNLASMAQEFLRQSANVNASTAAYAKDFADVQAMLSSAEGVAGGRAGVASAAETAAQAQVNLLQMINANLSSDSPNADLLAQQIAMLKAIGLSTGQAAAILGAGVNVLDAPSLLGSLSALLDMLRAIDLDMKTLIAAVEAANTAAHNALDRVAGDTTAQLAALVSAEADMQVIANVLKSGLTIQNAPTITAAIERLQADFASAGGGVDDALTKAFADLKAAVASGSFTPAGSAAATDALNKIAKGFDDIRAGSGGALTQPMTPDFQMTGYGAGLLSQSYASSVLQGLLSGLNDNEIFNGPAIQAVQTDFADLQVTFGELQSGLIEAVDSLTAQLADASANNPAGYVAQAELRDAIAKLSTIVQKVSDGYTNAQAA